MVVVVVVVVVVVYLKASNFSKTYPSLVIILIFDMVVASQH